MIFRLLKGHLMAFNRSFNGTQKITYRLAALYNLTEKTLRLAILREYGKEYHFKVK